MKRTKKPPPRERDPRYLQILELVERCIASPGTDYALISLSEMLYPFQDPELQDWDIEDAAALVRTYARYMPESMLDEVAARARYQMKSLHRWETEETYYGHCGGNDADKVRALAKCQRISIAEAYAKFKVAENLQREKTRAKLLAEAGTAAIAKADAAKAKAA